MVEHDDPVIDLVAVSKVYRSGDTEVIALNEVSLRIERGDSVAVMGTSGSGKSTLMNIIGCLDRPSAGTYRLNGVDVQRLASAERASLRNSMLGFVFQSFNLLSRVSALENVELPLLYAQPAVPGLQRRARALRALQRVGLESRQHHAPNQLSGGQQQRVAIARALVNEPRIVLADEPTGNLDSRTSAEIMAVLQSLSSSGITVVLVTHEQEIAAYCRRTVQMRDGRVIQDSVHDFPVHAPAEVVRG